MFLLGTAALRRNLRMRAISGRRSPAQNCNICAAPAHGSGRDAHPWRTRRARPHGGVSSSVLRTRAHRDPVASPLNVVVLAAGLGKRMHSALPKVLHPLAGRPLVSYVLAAARSLQPRAIAVVVGHGADVVQRTLAAPDLIFVLQDPPRGTGDAARVALAALPGDGVTLVTLGDAPLVPAAALAALVREAEAGHLAVLTAKVPDPDRPGPHRARRRGTGAGDRRGARRERRATRARRDQHRRDGRAHRAVRALDRRADDRQRAGRVLPDRRDRRRVRRRYSGRRPSGGRRARLPRHQRPRATRGRRARAAASACAGADGARRGAGRPRADRHPRRRSPAAAMCASTSAACSKAA